jgi:hypothetical protein
MSFFASNQRSRAVGHLPQLGSVLSSARSDNAIIGFAVGRFPQAQLGREDDAADELTERLVLESATTSIG